MRLPLNPDISSRDGSSTKNGRMYNVLGEKRPNGDRFAVVRPGLTQAASTTGSGKGLVCWNGTLVAMYGTTAYAATGGALTWVSLGSANDALSGGGSWIVSDDITAINGSRKTTNGFTWALITPTGSSVDLTRLWFVGNTLYAFDAEEAEFLRKSTDYGTTWTNVSTLPCLFDDAIYPTLAYVGSTLYFYGSDGNVYASTDLGSTWGSAQATTGIDRENPCPYYVVDGLLYLIDYPNSFGWVSSDYVNFTFFDLNYLSGSPAGCSHGFYDDGYFWVHTFTTNSSGVGIIKKIPISVLGTDSYTFAGNVAARTGSAGLEGDMFKIGDSHFSIGGTAPLGGSSLIYTDQVTMTSLGTVSGTFFDFAQSPT